LTLQHKLIKENGEGFHGNIGVRNAHCASVITRKNSDYLVFRQGKALGQELYQKPLAKGFTRIRVPT